MKEKISTEDLNAIQVYVFKNVLLVIFFDTLVQYYARTTSLDLIANKNGNLINGVFELIYCRIACAEEGAASENIITTCTHKGKNRICVSEMVWQNNSIHITFLSIPISNKLPLKQDCFISAYDNYVIQSNYKTLVFFKPRF